MSEDARIRLYNKIHGELVAEGMDPRAATREIAIRYPDVNAGRNAAVTEQAQARMANGGAVGRYDGGRATVSPHVSGGGAGAPAQVPTMTRAATASTGGATGDPEGEFERHVAAAVASGMARHVAVRSVVTKNPALHAAYLDAYNERNGIVSNFSADPRRVAAG